MNLQEFIPLATRTESQIDKVKFDKITLMRLLTIYQAVGTMLDMVKKNVFYGKAISNEKWDSSIQAMNASLQELNKGSYAPLLLQPEINVNPRLFHGIMGIATESTELIEILIKAIQTQNVDVVNLGEELFDGNWYQAILCDTYGIDWEKQLERGIQKLRARFPEKFDSNRAINRNTDIERKILEGEQNV